MILALLVACGQPESEPLESDATPQSYVCPDGSAPIEILPGPPDTCSEGISLEMIVMVCACDVSDTL